MSDLIERLRKAAHIQWQHIESVDASTILDDLAADEIERLEARCLKLYKANEKKTERIANLEGALHDCQQLLFEAVARGRRRTK